MIKIKMFALDYRRITESLPQRVYFTNFLILFLSVSFIFSSILAGFAYIEMIEVKNERKEILGNFNYWKEVADKHPNSPDAFFEAGFYALRLGDRDTASKLLDEAIRLDPSFEKAKKLSQQLTTDN